ncbi:hypothetical protein [Vulcanococcus sp. Clear-D1]|jgi:hypothetical protein|uniref:hypothetical protein n=1 Tax=Vulcanococcus sp. Clear-D1 TaxID=2766970 RepID=UPI0019CDAB8F|nr:hypothetical protein [Vulcanococcus sp. Clear-D1]MBD1194642.1 hypothetical protein [Vulcanococcus sp. Clear-D1]
MKKGLEYLSALSIIDPHWSSRVRAIFRSKTISYGIDSEFTLKSEVNYSREVKFIRRFLATTEPLTGLSFSYSTNTDCKPDLLIRFSLDDSLGIRGSTTLQKHRIEVNIEHFTTGYLMGNFKQVAAHELLHALGLSHPFGSGSYPGADVTDTLMSYNDFDPRFNRLTDLDRSALSCIWFDNLSCLY